MNDDPDLQEKIREALEAERLPNRRPDRMWGGPGGGAECTLCGEPVSPDQVEIELEFAATGPPSNSVTHHVHMRCLAAWDTERRRRAARLPEGHPAALPIETRGLPVWAPSGESGR